MDNSILIINVGQMSNINYLRKMHFEIRSVLRIFGIECIRYLDVVKVHYIIRFNTMSYIETNKIDYSNIDLTINTIEHVDILKEKIKDMQLKYKLNAIINA